MFIAAIVAIGVTITQRSVEDTLFGAISTRPHIWIFYVWESSIALVLAELVSHITTVFAQRLFLGAASQFRIDATAFVAKVQRC